MGTLVTVVRNAMLDVIPDADAPAGINYIELVFGDLEDPDFEVERHAISWKDASGGVLEQDETITIVLDLTETQASYVEVTGFKFYSLDDAVSPNGSGEFTESVELTSGYEYTLNVDGIQIELPE